jgi:hypothetical protein
MRSLMRRLLLFGLSEAILEPLKVHFLSVASDCITGEASKLQPQEKKLLAGEA